MKSNIGDDVVKKRSIFSFPDRMNSLTILIIILGYVIVFGIVSFLVTPNVSYTVVPEHEHELQNPVISTYVRKTTTINKQTDGTVNQKETVTAYYEKNEADGNEYEVNYELSGLTLKDNIDYMYTGSRSTFTTLPMTHTVKSEVSIKDGGYKAIFSKVRYRVKDSEEEKVYCFREDIITLSNKELRKAETDSSNIENRIGISKTINVDDATNKSSIILNIRILNGDEKYHLDIQTFIVSEKGEIYPIIGFYGYYSIHKNNLNGFSSFSTNLKAKYFVIKANYYNEDGKIETYIYKEEID